MRMAIRRITILCRFKWVALLILGVLLGMPFSAATTVVAGDRIVCEHCRPPHCWSAGTAAAPSPVVRHAPLCCAAAATSPPTAAPHSCCMDRADGALPDAFEYPLPQTARQYDSGGEVCRVASDDLNLMDEHEPQFIPHALTRAPIPFYLQNQSFRR
jgi:hypothetical protein